MKNYTVAQQLASMIAALNNCVESHNVEWEDRWRKAICWLCYNCLPSGSGWDVGTKIEFGKSNGEKLVLYGSFHHMDEHGGYDGWTDHTITVTPSFSGLDVTVSGKNRNDIKEYLWEMFHAALSETCPEIPCLVAARKEAV